MLAENVGVNATFYIDGGYSVHKGANGNWYVSIAASGHTLYSRNGVNMTVDSKITQQLPLVVPDGPAIGPAKYPVQFIGSVTMQLPNSGIVKINLSANYFIQAGSEGNRVSTTYTRVISIRIIGLPRR